MWIQTSYYAKTGLKKLEAHATRRWRPRGIDISKDQHVLNIAKAMAKLFRKDVVEWTMQQQHLKRYLTLDTLIRTEAVKDIKIPAYLHIWEDRYIGKHVVSKNYKWITTRNHIAHFFHERRGFEDFVNSGRLARTIDAYTTHQILLRLGLAIPKSLWIIAATGNFKASNCNWKTISGL